MRAVFYSLLSLVVCSQIAFGQIRFRALTNIPGALKSQFVIFQKSSKELLRDKVSFEQVQVLPLLNQQQRIFIRDAKFLSVENFPEVPFVSKKFPIPLGNIAEVHLDNAKIEESENSVDLMRVEEPKIWSSSRDFGFYSAKFERYFPGKFIEQKQIGSELWVTLFPVQVDRETGKILVLRSVDLRLEYREKGISVIMPSDSNPKAIIVTSEALVEAAKLLKDFHYSMFKVESEVVTVESIGQGETPVEENVLPEGYKDKEALKDEVEPYNPESKKGYNYELSRKIIRFLQKYMVEGRETRYVTILGDSNHVPPSYYFSVGSMYGLNFGVTDQCYAALNLCQEPRLAVGRLPFGSIGQLRDYLRKVLRWLDYVKSAPSELSLYGGKAFRGYHFIGELGVLRTLGVENVNWRGVEKYFRTKKNYNKDSVLSMVEGKKKSSFIYYLDHGRGNEWYVENQFVSSKEILEIGDWGSEVNPLIVSIACTNAAFDKPLVKSTIFGSDSHGDRSVGEALLLSRAGAVGYLGSSRPALGEPIVRIDQNGNLDVIGTNYGLQLLDTFLEKYHGAMGGSLGDIVLQALRHFLFGAGNDMSNDRNKWTYFNYALLGDPVLVLPWRNRFEKTVGVSSSSTVFDQVPRMGFPYFNLGEDLAQTFRLDFNGNSRLLASLLRVENWGSSETIERQEVLEGEKSLTLKADGILNDRNTFLVRLENLEGVPQERRVWFGINKQ